MGPNKLSHGQKYERMFLQITADVEHMPMCQNFLLLGSVFTLFILCFLSLVTLVFQLRRHAILNVRFYENDLHSSQLVQLCQLNLNSIHFPCYMLPTVILQWLLLGQLSQFTQYVILIRAFLLSSFFSLLMPLLFSFLTMHRCLAVHLSTAS